MQRELIQSATLVNIAQRRQDMTRLSVNQLRTRAAEAGASQDAIELATGPRWKHLSSSKRERLVELIVATEAAATLPGELVMLESDPDPFVSSSEPSRSSEDDAFLRFLSFLSFSFFPFSFLSFFPTLRRCFD